MSAAEEEPRPPDRGSPVPTLAASVFQEPDEWSDASAGADHDDWVGGVCRQVERVDTARNNRDLTSRRDTKNCAKNTHTHMLTNVYIPAI